MLAQSAALVVALLWVASLRRDLRLERRARQDYQSRNELLSDALIRSIETGSLERSKLSDQRLWLVDSMMRSFTDSLERALATVLGSSGSSSEPSKRETE